MRSPSSQWIPTKVTSSPTSSYSTPASVSITLQIFLGAIFDRTLSFSKNVSSLKPGFSFVSRVKALRCISASSWGLSKESLSLLRKVFLRSLLTYASPVWFPCLSVTNVTKLKRLNQVANRALFRLPLVLSYPTSSFRDASSSPTSHPVSFCSVIL